jgi:hypothetical protein
MKGKKAVLVAALNTCTHLLLTNVACELPAGLWHLFNILNRFHEGQISKRNLWDPECAKQMTPSERCSLLECPLCIWTEDATRRVSPDQLTLATKPLSLGNEWNSIAFLVHCEITAIAEYNRISVLAVSIIANCTSTVWFISVIRRFATDSSRRA